MTLAVVTGRTGFIGSHLVESLIAGGSPVRCLVRSPNRARRLRELGADIVVGKIDQPQAVYEAMRGASAVFHVAGCTKSLSKTAMFRVNKVGYRIVARACADEHKPPRLVVVSSVATSGPARGADR